MASHVDKSTASARGFWVSIVRIFVIEVLVLIALSGAVVGYLNWSSEVAFSEFLAASQHAASVKPMIHAIKERVPCDRGALARLRGSG